MESDDEILVCCGTPVQPLEDDEVPKKRPVSTEDQIVTDEKGRRRFHGAFTGGFSAGYFNSVGTKEGWTPSTFISSRSNRVSQKNQKPEDFMDQEDLGEFGIAHRTIQTTSKFSQQEKPTRKRHLPSQEGPIPGEPPLKDLIVPVKETVGVILLRKLGWRPGQGVGPRVKRKKQKHTGEIDRNEGYFPDEVNYEDEYAAKFDFAPDDVKITNYKAKDNVHGLGYSGLDQNTSVLGNLTSKKKSSVYFAEGKKIRISGQAFGVGVYEDDDEDIYCQEDMSDYHFTLEETPIKLHTNSESNRAATATKASNDLLPGFIMSSNKIRIFEKLYFHPPVLPKNYQPFHVVIKTEPTDVPTGLNRHSLNSASRAAILEQQQPQSVLNLISAEDKAKLEKAKQSLATGKVSLPNESLRQDNSKSTSSPFTLENFKPFAKNEVKQQKFEEYLRLFLSADGKDDFSKQLSFPLTEWERKEFHKTALLYKPLVGGIATRFVSAKNTDIVEELEMPKKPQVDKSDQQKAADMKMFGKLTREKVTWYPHNLLCKRFNVPNPYSKSSSGTSNNARNEKVSIFTMFNPSSEAGSNPPTQSDFKTSHTDPKISKADSESSDADPEKSVDIPIISEENMEENISEEEEKPPMDLFKAIFDNSDDSDDNSDEKETDKIAIEKQNSRKSSNLTSGLLNNETVQCRSISTTDITRSSISNVVTSNDTLHHLSESPAEATGLFANLDLDKLKAGLRLNSTKKPTESVCDLPKLSSAPSSSTALFYGPKLPPVTSDETRQHVFSTSEMASDRPQTDKNIKRHKDKVKKHKKHKHKHKSKKSKSHDYSDEALLSRLRKLNSGASSRKKGH